MEIASRSRREAKDAVYVSNVPAEGGSSFAPGVGFRVFGFGRCAHQHGISNGDGSIRELAPRSIAKAMRAI